MMSYDDPAKKSEGPTFEVLANVDDPSSQPMQRPHPYPASATNAAVSAALSAKDRGAALVASKSWGSAIEAYTDALIALPNENYLTTTRAILLTNRALCHQRLGNWEMCKDDCDLALNHDAESVKAWFRRAQAHLELNAPLEALSDIKQALKLEPKNREAKNLARKIVAECQKRRKDKEINLKRKGRQRKPGNNAKLHGLGNLYSDKLGAEVGTHVRLLERIRVAANSYTSRKDASASSSNQSGGGTIERTFAALLEPEGFRSRIYPGLKIPEGFDAPQSLQELLNDPRFHDSLVGMMPDVVKQSNSVLENVKSKAAAEGDLMDSATESALRPQILLEAFARQITKIIGQTSARFMAQALRSLAPIASIDDERADWDQLGDSLVAGLNDPDRLFGYQESFMGEDWVDAIREDIERIASTGRLQAGDPDHTPRARIKGADDSDSKISTGHRFALVGHKECKDDYPALAELIEQLVALPFELNKKKSVCKKEILGERDRKSDHVLLASPGAVSCAVSQIPSNTYREACIDGRTRGEPNGRELSFMYIVSCAKGSTFQLRHRSANATSSSLDNNTLQPGIMLSEVDMVADRLIAYRSLLVSNEIRANEEDVFVVTFFASACENKESLLGNP